MHVAPEEIYPGKQTRWRHEVYDNLIDKARRMMDHGKRMEMYREADRILMEEAVIIPLTYYRSHLLVKPWVKRFPMSAITETYWKDVIIDNH
jgi:oligopeptide transport system substrate-binding protein